jgi:hypothetical protein
MGLNTSPGTLAAVALTLLIGMICITVEALNFLAGRPLPTSATVSIHDTQAQTEPAWRSMRRSQTGDPTLQYRLLTPAEKSEMQADVGRNIAIAHLRTFVNTSGRLQAPLIAMAILISLSRITSHTGEKGTADCAEVRCDCHHLCDVYALSGILQFD